MTSVMGVATSRPPLNTCAPPVSPPPTARSDDDEDLVAETFTWSFGGSVVYVTGAWDGWSSKTPMRRRGAEHAAVIYVPRGVQEFKFYVDGHWQCSPMLETQTDAHGNMNNAVTVEAAPRTFDVTQCDAPSPASSYARTGSGNARELAGADVPQLPAQLRPFDERVGDAFSAHGAPHARVNHLFCRTDGDDGEVRALATQCTHNSKTITTIFVTPGDKGCTPNGM